MRDVPTGAFLSCKQDTKVIAVLPKLISRSIIVVPQAGQLHVSEENQQDPVYHKLICIIDNIIWLLTNNNNDLVHFICRSMVRSRQ